MTFWYTVGANRCILSKTSSLFAQCRVFGVRDMGKSRLFLGYETAFWIWRKAGPQAFSALAQSRVTSLAGGAPTAEKIRSFRAKHPDLATDVVHVIVRGGDRRDLPGVKTYARITPLPERSFYLLDDDVYVASPELCLMQLASKLSEQEVLKLALEMCGTYAIDPHYDPEGGSFYDSPDDEEQDDSPGTCKRPPLTNARKLKAYSERLLKPGSRARRAHFLRYVVDSSASPRETALYMLLCMPPRFGGYGLAIPELNRRIDFTLRDRLMIGADHFDCDLYWPKQVAVEYDSKRHHTAEEKQERDAIRRNMLQYKGIRVITATRLQVNSAHQFDKLARQIGRAVGKRFRIPEKEHVEARVRLRKTLFEWDVLSSWSAESDIDG